MAIILGLRARNGTGGLGKSRRHSHKEKARTDEPAAERSPSVRHASARLGNRSIPPPTSAERSPKRARARLAGVKATKCRPRGGAHAGRVGVYGCRMRDSSDS